MSPRRSAGAIAALLVGSALALTGVGPTGPGVGAEDAAAAGCEVVHHKKRIVKRRVIWRHGKRIVRRRVRIKRWTTCVPIPDPAPPTPLGVPAYDTGDSACGGTEMCLRPTRSSVPAGPVAVELSNLGEDPHTLRLSKVGGGGFFSLPVDPDGEILPGENERLTFTLTEGEWYLFCSLGEGPDSHEALGMSADLAVN